MTHIPLRMCVACRNHKPVDELMRITVTDGVATADSDKKNFARGAYICRNAECIKKAEKKHIIERHLKCSANPELYVRLVETL